ncbi:leucine--tRNA ligase [Chlamydiifrater volucris]|uniref:leucine--tRNA ligase n=1 Tax=Chlamydiifrater volucris TaxID=2681470 RepID=UPI001BCAA0E3|nr:leucine--tRNA ligase [Chlamydiifrater volucris]
MHYDPSMIESKWQTFWKDSKAFKAFEDASKKKYYILDMFPYPSGAGLHVGHLIGYTATDIVARYKRARGFSVMHPMGWDSFGLPAEQYAIRTGTHPGEITKKNIANFRKQLSAMGFSYDEDREFATSDPKYFKWTQKLFSILHSQGLAYMADMAVNYCPELGTVLSNEEVEDGFSVEGGYPVERRMLRQWVLKITAYADKLLEGLDELDWPESVKQLQRSWIGRSEGAEVQFAIEGKNKTLTVFTTRPETLAGVTFLVISPEHPLVADLISANTRESVEAYLSEASRKSERDRVSEGKIKTGVFSGSMVIHPITGQSIPVWISDYVVVGYGFGAVMGVPAHDERDKEFAEVFNLDIKGVICPDSQCCINSNFGDFCLNGLSIDRASDYVVRYLEKKKIGKAKVSYKLRDWLFSRQRYWGEPFPILHFEDGTYRVLEDDELPIVPPNVSDYKPDGLGKGPLARVSEWVNIQDPKTGKRAMRETHTMPQWAGSCWYYLRFCDATNDEAPWSESKERYWMPVDLYIGGAEHAVLHLLYARFWHRVFYDCGLVSTPEPFKKLVNQGLVLSTSYRIPGKGYVSPEDVVERNGQYFSKSGDALLVRQEKMSKSKLNGIDPQEIITEFGADALRMYAMFSGPLDKNKLWCNQSIAGCRRFLNRLYELSTSEKVCSQPADFDANVLVHKLIKKITEDIETLSLNTIPSAFMEFLNAFSKLPVYPKESLEVVFKLLAPIAPHVAEELWVLFGNQPGIDHAGWPTYDDKYLVSAIVVYVVQVNGKVRSRIEVSVEESREEILSKAKESVFKYLEGERIKKEIVVPGKLVSFAV